MAGRKKIVNGGISRIDYQKKVAEALAKKPTMIKTNPLEKGNQQFIQERLIKNAKNKRFKNNRQSVIRADGPIQGMLHDVPSINGLPTEIKTPSWFEVKEKVQVSIIIPMYKSNEVIVDMIKKWPIEKKLKTEIIYVDDKCPENSKNVVIKAWNSRKEELSDPVGKIIENRVNGGYGVACNSGASVASGEFLIFLNADTVPTTDWIEPMIKLFDDPEVGLVGNLQLKRGGTWDETIDSAGSEWCWNSNSFVHIGRHSHNKRGIPKPMKVSDAPKDILSVGEREMVTGCCFAIRADLFKYIGGFNPNYRIGYWEDSELCCNVRELGYKVMFAPESIIYHKLGHTQSGGHKFFIHNKEYFRNKWIKSGRLHNLLIPPEPAPEVKSILVKRAAAHGDVLVAAGVCAALKKKHPEATIMFSSSLPEVTNNNPYIDQFVEFKDSDKVSVDVLYNLDLSYEWRPNVNILTAYAEYCGVKKEDCVVYLAQKALKEELPEDFIIIHPGRTNWAGRDWPHENFVKLSKMLIEAGEKVVCIGKYAEGEIPCTMDIRGKTTIAQMAWVMKRAKLFIGIDSFPMHVAQVANIPAVAFFGCVKPELRIYNKNIVGITAKNLACLGCHHRRPAPLTATKVCETGTFDCIKQVSVEDMLAVVNNLLCKDQNDLVSLMG